VVIHVVKFPLVVVHVVVTVVVGAPAIVVVFAFGCPLIGPVVTTVAFGCPLIGPVVTTVAFGCPLIGPALPLAKYTFGKKDIVIIAIRTELRIIFEKDFEIMFIPSLYDTLIFKVVLSYWCNDINISSHR